MFSSFRSSWFGLIAFGLVNINGVWQKKLDAEAEGVHLSRQQMSEELDEAYDLLNRYHPYAHLYRSRKELDLVYAAIKNDIRQDNDLATSLLAACAHDGVCLRLSHEYFRRRASVATGI